jgi:hypothetical protein
MMQVGGVEGWRIHDCARRCKYAVIVVDGREMYIQ